MNIPFTRRRFFKASTASVIGWAAHRLLGTPAEASLPAVDVPEQMDPERLALWKRSPRLPLLESDDSTISHILLAIHNRRTITFSYGGFSGTEMARTICPGAVFRVDGFRPTYVSGFCFTRAEERTFCIERITLS